MADVVVADAVVTDGGVAVTIGAVVAVVLAIGSASTVVTTAVGMAAGVVGCADGCDVAATAAGAEGGCCCCCRGFVGLGITGWTLGVAGVVCCMEAATAGVVDGGPCTSLSGNYKILIYVFMIKTRNTAKFAHLYLFAFNSE